MLLLEAFASVVPATATCVPPYALIMNTLSAMWARYIQISEFWYMPALSSFNLQERTSTVTPPRYV